MSQIDLYTIATRISGATRNTSEFTSAHSLLKVKPHNAPSKRGRKGTGAHSAARRRSLGVSSE